MFLVTLVVIWMIVLVIAALLPYVIGLIAVAFVAGLIVRAWKKASMRDEQETPLRQ